MDITQIKINPNNPRLIKDEKFKKLVKSLNELPVMTELREVVLDENNIIIGGNMRYRAAVEAGWKEIPTKVFTREMADRNNEITKQNKTYEEYIREIIIKDNVSGGEWDWDMLGNQYEKEELEDWGMDVDKWADDEVVEDEVPEVTENPKSKLGEIYQLGRHRVMCGDSTKIEDVERLMDGKKADMVFTDPPYGIDWNTDYTRFTGGLIPTNNYSKIKGDNFEFNPTTWIQDYEQCLFFGANCFSDKLPKGNWIVWDKRFENGEAFLADAEVAWYSGGGAVYIIKETHQGFVSSDSQRFHPTQKPVGLLIKIFDKIKAPNIILDIFLGSGSTLIACEQTNRICYGMEIDPKYVDVIRKRYAKFIGKEDNWEEETPCIA